jgi:dTDP-4-dehydrorhamnose reductase
MRILVTGKNGALGKAIMKLSALNTFPSAEFIFTDSKSLELTNKKQVEDFFNVNKPNYVLHLASKSGVAKSGSPKLILMTLTPFSLSSFPKRAMARVSDSANFSTRFDK